jgi:predicted nucleic acid-binding protein
MSQRYSIYLDVCCLNRPFDNSSQDRIRLEAEAVLTIYRKCRLEEWELTTSEVIEAELQQTPDRKKAELIMAALNIAKHKVMIDSGLKQRASELVQFGIKSIDAVHVASAEAAEVDVFLSTDDRLVRTAVRHQAKLKVLVSNPVTWLMSLSSHEGDNAE